MTAEPAAPAADITGVEIRLIGPPGECAKILALMEAAGIPMPVARGPLNATDRPGTERHYRYTDEQTARDCRRRSRSGRPDRPSRRRGETA